MNSANTQTVSNTIPCNRILHTKKNYKFNSSFGLKFSFNVLINRTGMGDALCNLNLILKNVKVFILGTVAFYSLNRNLNVNPYPDSAL